MTQPIIDTNVYLSRWPFRRLPGDEIPDLVAKLRSQNVDRAWVGSFDGLLHRDITAVNERLAHDCQRFGDGLLVPFGSINPTLPDWEEDVRRCHEVLHMHGIRLHPNYHGYQLADPVATRLFNVLAERRLIVQLAVSMEDERTQHRLARVPHVDTASLPALLRATPTVRLVLLNAFRGLRPDQVPPLLAAGNCHVDIAMLEGVNGVSKLIEYATSARIVFGSYHPFFYHESATLKLRESPLAASDRAAIAFDNAARLLQ